MRTVKLTEEQIDVIAYALEYMGTEWSYVSRQLSDSKSVESTSMKDSDKKEVRKQLRVARNILLKLGFSKDNF